MKIMAIFDNNIYVMHQSFVIKAPMGPGNNGDIDFYLCKVCVYAWHCGDSLMVKALLKAQLKSWQLNLKLLQLV